MNDHISVLAELDMSLGECPRWNIPEQAWYWVDITGHTLYRFCTMTDILSHRKFSFQPAAFFFTDKNEIILTSSSGIYRLNSFDDNEVLISHPELALPSNRFNDGASAPDGSFICGSIGDGNHPVGSTYQCQFKENKLITSLLQDNYTIVNGQAFSPDGQWYYVTDTPNQEILKYSYDSEKQKISKPEVFFSFKETNEFPDGAAVDKEGNYWIALYGSGKICQISPEGKRLQDIELPISQPTMLCFGGVGLSQIIVTSANQGLSEEQRLNEPLAGSLLIIDTNITGFVPTAVKS